MKYDTATPFIASYVIIRKDDKIAFVLRSNTGWMDGYYGLPSGKVEIGETFSECAVREAKEEVGVDIKEEDLKFLHVQHRQEETLWVDVCFEAVKWEGEPYNMELDKHGELVWFKTDDMPNNIVPSVRHMLEQIVQGNTYSEYFISG